MLFNVLLALVIVLTPFFAIGLVTMLPDEIDEQMK